MKNLAPQQRGRDTFGEPRVEPTEVLAERVATLYQALSRPSATRFKAALAKRGIRVPDAFVRQLVSEQGSRQLFAPPPRFTGKVVAQHVDERWAADVIDCRTSSAVSSLPWLSGARQRWKRLFYVCCGTPSAERKS